MSPPAIGAQLLTAVSLVVSGLLVAAVGFFMATNCDEGAAVGKEVVCIDTDGEGREVTWGACVGAKVTKSTGSPV